MTEERGERMDETMPDEMDRLLSAIEPVAPPVDFVARVLAKARAEGAPAASPPAAREAALYGAIYLLGLVGLGLLAYEAGLALARNGTGALVAALLADLAIVADAPGTYLGAVVASIPWLQVAALALDLAILAIVTRLMLRGDTQGARGRRAGAGA